MKAGGETAILGGMKQGTPTFRVFTQSEIAAKLQASDAQYYFIASSR